MATILETQTITFYPDDSYGGLCTVNLGSGSLTEGEIYDVYFDGQKYTCTAEPMALGTMSGIGLGNKAILGIGEDSGEPFIIGNAYGMLVCILNETEESAHEIAIYSQVLFPKQTVTGFAFMDSYGAYHAGINPAPFIAVIGNKYEIYWDGNTYICEAQDLSALGAHVGIGDFSSFGGTGNGEPFAIGSSSVGISIFTRDSAESHVIGVYEYAETEEPEEPQGITLRNYHGENVVHEDIETLSVNNTEGGIDTFTRGIAVEDVPITLDFSDGDQIVTATDGYLVKSAVIEKPETLIPENIRIGQNIAGIDGSFIGEAEETEVDLYMADGDMVITPSENKLLSSVTVKKPETLIAANIADGIDIAGILGTHKGGGGGWVPKIVSTNGYYEPTTTGAVVVEHNLGVLPDLMLVTAAEFTTSGNLISNLAMCPELGFDGKYGQHLNFRNDQGGGVGMRMGTNIYTGSSIFGEISKVTPNTFQIGSENVTHLIGKTYHYNILGGIFERKVLNIQLSLDGEGNLIIRGGVPEIEQFNIYLDGTLKKTVDYTYSEDDLIVDLSEFVEEYQSYTVTIECVGDISSYTNQFIGSVSGWVLGSMTWHVESVGGASHGFELQGDYYVSKNKGVNNSAAVCKVVILSPNGCTATFSCINYAESNYDFGILSTIDNTLGTGYTADSTNVYKSFKGSSMSSVQTVTYTVPAGEHFIYVKFRKDSSTHSNNDTLQFTVTLS